jgi:hypothetical protein
MNASLTNPDPAALTPGTWYIAVVCSCKKRIVLFRDLTAGKGTLQGDFGLVCPECGKSGSFPAEHYLYQSDDTSKAVTYAEKT